MLLSYDLHGSILPSLQERERRTENGRELEAARLKNGRVSGLWGVVAGKEIVLSFFFFFFKPQYFKLLHFNLF